MENKAKLLVSLPEDLEQQLRQHYDDLVTTAVEKALSDEFLARPVLRRSALAEWLGVSPNTILKWQGYGLPTIVIDGVVMFDKMAVLGWVKQFER